MKRYEKYKPSGVEWLGEVPEHWEIKPLKFAVSYNDETLPENTDLDEEILYVDISSVSLTDGIKNKELMIFENAPSRARRIVKDGDVLVSTVRTYLKAIAQVESAEPNLIASTGFAVLRSKCGLNSQYLGYYIQSEGIVGAIVANSVGVSYPAINASDLVRLPICIPSENEQTIIANYLDKKNEKIDRLISRQQALLEKLSEKRTALITETVCGRVRLATALNDNETLSSNVPLRNSGIEWLGEVPEHWLITRLKYVGEIVLGLTYSPEDITNDENAILVLRSSNVQNGKLLLNDNVYVNKDIPKKMQTTENDILICSRNGSRALIGKCAVIEGDAIGQTFGAFMTVFRSPYKRFIYYVLSSELFKSQLGNYLTSTINQLTTQVLGNFEIAFPPESEQTTIVNYLDTETAKIDHLQNKIERVIERLKEYRSALITQVVTGKVKV